MPNRRRFLQYTGSAGLTAALPKFVAATEQQRLPTRLIPGTSETLPIVGLGNSNAFRQGDLKVSQDLIELFRNRGGAYIDCSGSSRFAVGEVAQTINAGNDLFLGTYFTNKDASLDRQEADRVLALTGKKQLDLMHSYLEHAEPNWDKFRRFKEEGLTRYIGIARHRKEFYETMMKMMHTGTVDFLQVNYSLLETEAEQRVLPLAQELGVAVTINRPFINGRYFQRVKGHTLPPWAADYDINSWAQFSVKFIVSHPAVNCVLTETANLKHAIDNIGGGFGRLPDQKVRQQMLQVIRDLG